MKSSVIILGIASLLGLASLFSAEAREGGAKPPKAAVTLNQKVFSTVPGKNIVLSGKITVPKGVKPQVWAVYAYFPSMPKRFRYESKLKVINPKSAWGLVQIKKHTPMSHILRKDGTFSIVIPTKNWVEGCYAIVFSTAYFDPAGKGGKGQHYSVPLTFYVVLED